MATSDDVLAVARGEIGYSRWEDEQNGSVFGRWYADLVGNPAYAQNGVPYCAMFVSWCFDQAGATADGLPGAYCPWMLSAAADAGALVYNEDSQPGDIIYFDWNKDGTADHVGIVESNEGDWVQTIEGNTDGGQVLRRARSWEYVIGVARPSFEAWEQPTDELMRIVDCSNHDGDAGWMPHDAPSAQAFIIKASEGTYFVDWWAKDFADDASYMGKRIGFYHFARRSDAQDEARHFVACVKDTGHLAEATLWLDYEAEALANGPGWCHEFIAAVNSMTGKTCGLYTSKSVTHEQDFSAMAPTVPLWGAQYANYNPTTWEMHPWQSGDWGAWGAACSIHQYTSVGVVDESPKYLDLNRGYIDTEDWDAWAYGKPEPGPAPDPEALDVDGWLGPVSIARLQYYFDTYCDGVVSGQVAGNSARTWALVSKTYSGEGSPMVAAIQRYLGIADDGHWGEQTNVAIQERLCACGHAVEVDGWLGNATAAALQAALNDESF